MNYQNIENHIAMGELDENCAFNGNFTGEDWVGSIYFEYDVEIKNGLVDFVNTIKCFKDRGEKELIEIDSDKNLIKTIINFIEEEVA